MTWRELSDLFVQIELELIASLRRNLTAHKAWEEKEAFGGRPGRKKKSKFRILRRENQALSESLLRSSIRKLKLCCGTNTPKEWNG